MKFRHAFIFIPCLIVSVWTAVTPARAATITETYNYSITIAGGPIPWFGSVTLTFDPTVASPSAPPDAFWSNLPASYGSFVFTMALLYSSETVAPVSPAVLVLAAIERSLLLLWIAQG